MKKENIKSERKIDMLQGKVAVITGGTRGIGFATAEAFLKNKAKVVIFGSKKETVENAVKNLKEKYDEKEIMGLYPNLSNENSIQDAFQAVIQQFQKIDILVNNAGISSRTSIYEYTNEEFKTIMDLNVNATFTCSKIAAEQMKKQGGGVILNTSSMVSLYGQPSGCGYPTSKFAINGLTKSLARELGRDHIRVNAVAPGIIMTDMMASVPEEVIHPIIKTIPLGRIGMPEDIANAFVFLASDQASYISGTILSVDGATMS